MDGIEKELAGTADVIRLDLMGRLGRQIAGRYGISGMPTLLVMDAAGEVVYRQGGPPSKAKVIEAVHAASH